MKNSRICPKCEGSNIVRIDGKCGPYGVGNNIITGSTLFSAVGVDRYICLDCGYSEEWIDRESLGKIKESRHSKKSW